jgi:hypothetical protein
MMKNEKFKFLLCAERYAETQGDEMWFKHLYTLCREHNDITESIWKTLSYLYSNEVADLMKNQQ